jgi:IS30 family transposase
MRSYAHLSEDERDQIGVLRAAGRSMGAIARALGRAKATISRELQRNALPLGGYSPLHAAGAYQLRSGVKRSSNERPLYVCSWGTVSPRDGRPNRSPVG